MGEERLIILKLLEQGKITEAEAEQLLDALGDIEYNQATQEASNTFEEPKVNLSKSNDPYKEKDEDPIHNESSKNINFEEALESIGKRFESLGHQLEDKVDIFSEQFAKKMIGLGSLFANKSMDFAERIIDVVEKTLDSDALVNGDLFGSQKSYEEVIERKLDGGFNQSLQFQGYNGSITINPWEEPMIKVTAHITSRENKYEASQPILEFKEEGDTLYFYPKEVEGMEVKLNIQLPNRTYNLIKLQSKNGFILAQGLNCNKLLLQTRNGSINLKNTRTEKDTSCTTTNGKVIIENCRAENLLAATKNGRIFIEGSSIRRIEGLTSNSKITIKDIEYELLQALSLKTTNSKIEVVGSIPKSKALKFEGSTTHGNINIGIPMVYSENIKNYSNHRIKAQTDVPSIDETPAYIKTYTTNASIYLFC